MITEELELRNGLELEMEKKCKHSLAHNSFFFLVKMRQTDVWIKLTQNEEKTKMYVFCFFHLR
jgi:hypothetical protein